MRKIICLFALSFVFALICSCSKTESIDSITDCNINVIDSKEAEKEFAIILSKAVYESEPLRLFLKTEALKQFDKDFDVFYPFVKDEIICGGLTFRDILIQFCDDINTFERIEESVSKLTILIPDFSWIDENCFSVNNWDTRSTIVAVGYDDRGESHPLFCNGELVCYLTADSFPAFPVLIIKENERMKMIPNTKTGENVYTFIDQVFDNSINTKGNNWAWGDISEVWDNDEQKWYCDLVSDQKNYISKDIIETISPKSVEAWEEFGTAWSNACQRDYIYYGMNKSNKNNGSLNQQMRDMIFRFSLKAESLYTIANDINNDPLISHPLETTNSDKPKFTEAIERMWSNGNYEIRIEIYQGAENGGSGYIDSFTFSIQPKRLMYISKCDRRFIWNVWGQGWSTYSLKQDYIEPKWYYPSDDGNIMLINNSWDLSKLSDDLWFRVLEVDDKTEYTYSLSQSFKYSSSVKGDSSNETSKKIGFGVSGSYGSEQTLSSSFNVKTVHESDCIGEGFIHYVNNIISGSNERNYTLETINTGCFDFNIVPIDSNKQTSIREYLLTRQPYNGHYARVGE